MSNLLYINNNNKLIVCPGTNKLRQECCLNCLTLCETFLCAHVNISKNWLALPNECGSGISTPTIGIPEDIPQTEASNPCCWSITASEEDGDETESITTTICIDTVLNKVKIYIIRDWTDNGNSSYQTIGSNDWHNLSAQDCDALVKGNIITINDLKRTAGCPGYEDEDNNGEITLSLTEDNCDLCSTLCEFLCTHIGIFDGWLVLPSACIDAGISTPTIGIPEDIPQTEASNPCCWSITASEEDGDETESITTTICIDMTLKKVSVCIERYWIDKGSSGKSSYQTIGCDGWHFLSVEDCNTLANGDEITITGLERTAGCPGNEDSDSDGEITLSLTQADCRDVGPPSTCDTICGTKAMPNPIVKLGGWPTPPSIPTYPPIHCDGITGPCPTPLSTVVVPYLNPCSWYTNWKSGTCYPKNTGVPHEGWWIDVNLDTGNLRVTYVQYLVFACNPPSGESNYHWWSLWVDTGRGLDEQAIEDLCNGLPISWSATHYIDLYCYGWLAAQTQANTTISVRF